MAKDPAFLFYSSDFLVGTQLFNMEQRGKYITLLCLQHQSGHILEEDMIKTCGTYDKDIFRKFEQDINGLYYNKRLEEECNKRAVYTNSRRINRLGKKNVNTSERHVEDMLPHVSNTSNSYVERMENENTPYNKSIGNKGLKEKEGNISNIIIKEADENVFDTRITYDEDMLKTEILHYQGNWTLEATTAICVHFFFEHREFAPDRAKVFEKIKRLMLDTPDDEVWDRIHRWVNLFNERNDGDRPKRTMRGKDSWPQHFYNWFCQQPLGENPEARKPKNNFQKTTTAPATISVANLTREQQNEMYKNQKI